MKIVKYSFRELLDEECRESLLSRDVLPITRHKLLSFVNNPNAKEDDVLLLVAYDGDAVVGYIGLLPDRVFIDGAERRIAWLTSWWVDPRYRRQGTGGFLLVTAMNHYPIVTSGSTDEADKVFAASKKLTLLKTLKGRELIVRSCSARFIRKKYPKLQGLTPVMECIDGFLNIFVDLRFLLWKRRHARLEPFLVEFVAEIDHQTDRFIHEHRERELYRRGAEELNWAIRYPWVLPAPFADRTASRYYFSSLAKRFFHLNAKVYDHEKRMVGFVMFRVRDNHMTIPYIYYERSALERVVNLIGRCIVELGIDSFTTYNQEIMSSLISFRFPYLFQINRSRNYYISTALDGTILGSHVFQDGTGDTIFT
ncbi:MAG: GNAT family N-acetyltransferase [Desulfomonilia bacterium]|jgi:hypothetical protein